MLHSFALNYKGLPVKTEWVEYPDIKALYHKLGLEATETKQDGSPYYCLPVIHDPSTDTTLSDSLTIVRYLDKAYPDTPTLLPRGTLALQKGCMAGFGRAHGSMYTLVVRPVWRILNEPSQTYYRSMCEGFLGQKLEDVCTEKSWQAAEEAWKPVAEWMKLNGEGLEGFIMGDKVCYVDLQIVSILVWAKNSTGEDSEGWKRICSWSGGKWKRYLDSFAKYEVVDA